MNGKFLLPFTVLVGVVISCCKDWGIEPPPVPPVPLDSTSHNFVFSVDTLGNGDNPSYLKDVAIISDTLIYAVGELYLQGDLQPYNLAVWNGTSWAIRRATVNFRGNLITPPLEGAFAFSATDIWLSSGVPVHGDGVSWTQFHLFDMGVLDQNDGSLSKVWGTNSSNLFYVGGKGTIVHFNGSTWTKMISGTTVDLRDVWGSPDGSVVWACGYSNDLSQSVLLKYQNGSWQTVWKKESPGSVPPYGDIVSSIWVSNELFTAGNGGVFKETTNLLTVSSFPYRIRGSLANNIAVVGDNAIIWHYNGSSFKQLHIAGNEPLYSVAVSTRMIVAVGVYYNRFPQPAIVYRGMRQE